MDADTTIGPDDLVDRVEQYQMDGVDELDAIRKTVNDFLTAT